MDQAGSKNAAQTTKLKVAKGANDTHKQSYPVEHALVCEALNSVIFGQKKNENKAQSGAREGKSGTVVVCLSCMHPTQDGLGLIPSIPYYFQAC